MKDIGGWSGELLLLRVFLLSMFFIFSKGLHDAFVVDGPVASFGFSAMSMPRVQTVKCTIS